MQSDKLEMSFDPNTIDHLGVRMYSTLPPVVAELVANAHDADAHKVYVQLFDELEKVIVITDDGHGMSFDDINSSFLRIGRNRREDSATTPEGRKVIGRKGLGKLSYFGIAETIEVSTVKNGLRNVFSMSLNDIHSEKGGAYYPRMIKHNEQTADSSGTIITLKEINRQSKFSAEGLAASLARIFYFGDELQIWVSRNKGAPVAVSKELRFDNITQQFNWTIPQDAPEEQQSYCLEHNILGNIITSEKPLQPSLRGITLYSRGKLVNNPECFVGNDSSHFFSYLTGFLDVSFVDDLDDDVLSTNRQSLDWSHSVTIELRGNLEATVRAIERDWREKRKAQKQSRVKEETGIDVSSWLQNNTGEERSSIQRIVDELVDAPEASSAMAEQILREVHYLVPEYAKYHWRHLHAEVKTASEKYYRTGDYYHAVLECAKHYVAAVKKKSQTNLEDELSLLGNAFGGNSPLLLVAVSYRKTDGTCFSKATQDSIQQGNRGLAQGVWQGCRNPISHEEIGELGSSGLFTEADCLDALSILSHLFRRLDGSVTSDATLNSDG